MGDLVRMVAEEGRLSSLEPRPPLGCYVTSIFFHRFDKAFRSDVMVEGLRDLVANVQSGPVIGHVKGWRRTTLFHAHLFYFRGEPDGYTATLSVRQKDVNYGWIDGDLDPCSPEGQQFLRELAVKRGFS